MDVKAARRMPIEQGRYGRVRQFPAGSKVCSYWLAGRCTRKPCRFLHVELPSQNTCHHEQKPSFNTKDSGSSKSLEVKGGLEPQERLCQRWASGSCAKGDKCVFQHSWSRGEGFGLLAKLEGHEKGIAGIGFPAGSDKLYTGCRDGTVKIWDCHTGQCSATVNVGGEVGSLICERSWAFVGLRNVIKAWNMETGSCFDLDLSSGLVYSMAVEKDLLFAGCQNGDILVWRGSSPASPPQLVATLKGHTRAVVSLVVGANRLYSGSVDQAIMVWDIYSLECVTTLKGHTDVVMSLLCWDHYLLSCSLDGKINVWVASSSGVDTLEVLYTHNEDHGVLAFRGMHDMEGKPILITACNDDTVRLYELPTFIERGRIFSRREVLALQVAPACGLFFTGDGNGTLSVWKWSEDSQSMG